MLRRRRSIIHESNANAPSQSNTIIQLSCHPGGNIDPPLIKQINWCVLRCSVQSRCQPPPPRYPPLLVASADIDILSFNILRCRAYCHCQPFCISRHHNASRQHQLPEPLRRWCRNITAPMKPMKWKERRSSRCCSCSGAIPIRLPTSTAGAEAAAWRYQHQLPMGLGLSSCFQICLYSCPPALTRERKGTCRLERVGRRSVYLRSSGKREDM